MTIKNAIFVLSGLLLCTPALAEETVYREPIEWCDMRVNSTDMTDKPRVLLVGDSIAQAYYETVSKKLAGSAYCAKLATSSCVADPAFHRQIEFMLSQYDWDLIHFNNGLHGSRYTVAQYEEGCRKALELIKRHEPNAVVILALTTPLQSTSEKASMNSLVDKRNQVLKVLAGEYDLEIDDLHMISKDHPEYYKDPFHYKPEAIALQSEQVASTIRNAFNAE